MILCKPSKLEKAVAKWEKRLQSADEKRRAKRLHDEAWRKVSEAVSIRDKHTCRVCKRPTIRYGTGDPRLVGQSHHIIYRSAGGKDTLENCVWICGQCSDDEHTHRIDITGTSSQLKIARPA